LNTKIQTLTTPILMNLTEMKMMFQADSLND
jgi:hypothetical protein